MEAERLRQIPLLLKADPDILNRCVEEKRIWKKKYARGATVYCQRDPCATLDVVLSGHLAAYSLSEKGSAVTMFEFKKNGIIGANLLFGDGNAYPFTICAATACELLHITKSATMELLRGYDFVISYIRSLSLNSLGMNRRLTMMTQKTLRDNLLEYLRHQAFLQGSSHIRLPVSKKELADDLGVQRPSLFRELKKMTDEGLIVVSNRMIKILDP